MRCKLLLSVVLAFVITFCTTNVFAIPVDLSNFEMIDPTVTIGPGNSSASIIEDPSFAPVGLWESDLPVPDDAMSLTFYYELVVAPDNEDYFDFYFGDLTGPSDSIGGLENIYAGTVTRDLAAFAGTTLPLAFTLNSNFLGKDGGYESVLTISNVEINPVPEPSTVFLVGAGLIIIAGIRRKLAM